MFEENFDLFVQPELNNGKVKFERIGVWMRSNGVKHHFFKIFFKYREYRVSVGFAQSSTDSALPLCQQFYCFYCVEGRPKPINTRTHL